MAQKWQNQDSARTMTNKYNKTVEEVNELKQQSSQSNSEQEKTLQEIRKELDSKVNSETAKTDLQLDKVDNTSDMDKPVSNPTARAIENAVEGMLTSEPIDSELDVTPPIGVLSDIHISGTKLIMNTDTAEVVQKISIYLQDSRLVFIAG